MLDFRFTAFSELRPNGVLRSSGAIVGASTLVLLEHAAHLLYKAVELPHPFFTQLSDTFLLQARYDLVRYPPCCPSSLCEADDPGPAIGGVRHTLHVTCFLEPVYGVAHRLLGRVGQLGQLGQAKSSLPKVVKDVSSPRRSIGETGFGQSGVQPREHG